MSEHMREWGRHDPGFLVLMTVWLVTPLPGTGGRAGWVLIWLELGGWIRALLYGDWECPGVSTLSHAVQLFVPWQW